MVNRATNSHLASNHLKIQTMHLEIITPDRKVFAGEVTSAQFPGSDGLCEVLNSHPPLLRAL